MRTTPIVRLGVPVLALAAPVAVLAVLNLVLAATPSAAPAPGADGAAGAPAIGPGGLAWRRVAVPQLGAELQRVARTADGFVAIGGPVNATGVPLVLQSQDGEAWSVVPAAAYGGEVPIDLQDAGDRFVLRTARPAPAIRDLEHVWASEDGLAWRRWLPARPGDPIPDVVAHAGTGWVGTNGDGILGSDDGLGWSVLRATPLGRPVMASGGAGAIVVTTTSVERNSTFQARTMVAGRGEGLLEGGAPAIVWSVSSGTTRFVAVGLGAHPGPTPDPREWAFEDRSSLLSPTAWWSRDGLAWQRGDWRPGRIDMAAVQPFGNGFIASTPFDVRLWASPDGARWTELAPVPWAADEVVGLVADRGRLLAFTHPDVGGPDLWIGQPR